MTYLLESHVPVSFSPSDSSPMVPFEDHVRIHRMATNSVLSIFGAVASTTWMTGVESFTARKTAVPTAITATPWMAIPTASDSSKDGASMSYPATRFVSLSFPSPSLALETNLLPILFLEKGVERARIRALVQRGFVFSIGIVCLSDDKP